MHSIELPDLIWAELPSLELAMLRQGNPNMAIDDYAWMLEHPTRRYLRAFRSYPRGAA